MKIVHTADWHLGKSLNDYSLLSDQEFYFNAFVSDLRRDPPDVVVLAGDIYDRSVPGADAVALFDQLLHRLIQELHLQVLVIAGNHDSPERLQFGRQLLAPSGLHIAAKEPVVVTLIDALGEVDFHLIPYFSLHRLRAHFGENPPQTLQEGWERLLAEQQAGFVPNRRNVLVAHGFFAFGSESAAEETVGGSELVSIGAHGFDCVLLGHLHGACSAGLRARYSGSPLKYSVDEADQHKSYERILLEQQVTLSCQELPPLRDLRVLSGSFAELLAAPPSDDYLSLHLTDEQPVPDAALQLKAIYPHLLELHWVGFTFHAVETLPALEQLDDTHLPGLFAEFYEQMMDRPLSAVQQEILEQAGGVQ